MKPALIAAAAVALLIAGFFAYQISRTNHQREICAEMVRAIIEAGPPANAEDATGRLGEISAKLPDDPKIRRAFEQFRNQVISSAGARTGYSVESLKLGGQQFLDKLQGID